LTGYRINFNTFPRILRSLFMLHNESVNVWSHLLGVLLFIGLIFHTFHFKAPPAMQSWIGEGVAEQRQMDARRV